MESEIIKLHQNLLNGRITCVDLVNRKISLLKKNGHNTANTILAGPALYAAAKVDRKIKAGEEIGLLEGIPFGVKDVFLMKGARATASSDFLRDYESSYTATAVQKLLDAGAIPIVKENCDSFGHGSSNENTIFGPVLNANDKELVAGGSSGGSAVNVARGNTAFSIGGDTGGSIRQPAGYNKVYGLKPTYGRISRYGLMAYASSTDCVGPLANSLEDIRILLNAMSGKDPHDQTSHESSEIPASIYEEEYPNTSLKVGYYKNFLENKDLDADIRNDFLTHLEKLEDNNIEITELDFFDTDVLVSTYYVLAMAETASNLARLDGMSYGGRLTSDSLKEGYALTRSEKFSEESKRRIIGGNQILSQGHAEEIYLKARILRNQVIESFTKDFQSVDLILSPLSPHKIPALGSSLKDPLKMYLSDAYTVGFSLGGLPTLTAPLGNELGIQITAPKNEEKEILKFAKFLSEID